MTLVSDRPVVEARGVRSGKLRLGLLPFGSQTVFLLGHLEPTHQRRGRRPGGNRIVPEPIPPPYRMGLLHSRQSGSSQTHILPRPNLRRRKPAAKEIVMDCPSAKSSSPTTRPMVPWNKGAFVGPKPPLKPKQVWSIRLNLQREHRLRDLALFDVAIDSKLRGCDLVQLRIGELVINAAARHRATIVQQKTGKPVQVELTEQTRDSLIAWLTHRGGGLRDFGRGSESADFGLHRRAETAGLFRPDFDWKVVCSGRRLACPDQACWG